MKPEGTVQLSQLLEVWESISGWYWFVTEYHENGIAFGLVKGFEIECGYFDLNELCRLSRRHMVWKVHKQDWEVCPCVVDDADSSSWNGKSLGSRQSKATPNGESNKRRMSRKW
jgi:hypothetical protein